MEPSQANFCHPYQPYDIQLQFMLNLYQCIDAGGVGIFESPTGTGKSLSLICGSLTWLRDHKRRSVDRAVDEATTSGGPDWLLQAEKQELRRRLTEQRLELQKSLNELRNKDASKTSIGNTEGQAIKRQKHRQPNNDQHTPQVEDDYVLADYASDDQAEQSKGLSENGLSERTMGLLEMLEGKHASSRSGEDLSDDPKIIFCSRTHSQLSQFVTELRKVNPPTSLLSSVGDDEEIHVETVKQLSLGSRKNLCINDRVLRLSSTTAINERCLELQKPKTSKEQKCSFVPAKENQELVPVFRRHALSRLRDIEDLSNLGRKLGICPYYAARATIAPSEVLTLPYPLLLQKSAREAMCLSVKDNVIIIDEAHNLMDAVTDAFSVSLSLKQLELATSRIMNYVQKFKNKLKGKNRVYVTQVIRLLNSITAALTRSRNNTRHDSVLSHSELMSGKGVDQIRPHQLSSYLKDSKLAYKVDGYAEFADQQSNHTMEKGTLMHLQNFLMVLMNPAAEGRFLISCQEDDVHLRYVLLDPREHFRDVVEDARAVILAGGTMSPMSDYRNYLFSYLPVGKLQTYSFGHIVPPQNLCVQPIILGTTRVEFDFTFDKRNSHEMIFELGRLLIKACEIVPDGIVVFFPSYDYLAQVVKLWKTASAGLSVISQLNATKKVFEESKGIAVDRLLRDYSEAIDAGHGSIMLSVVGGKLSEGINFSDKLGRAVVAVGLPFANMHGAEWNAKIEYVEQAKADQLRQEDRTPEAEIKAQAKAAGRDFYENACMRAVNQCIGRVIRHQNDYAAILLVDRRFATERIHRKLPAWIRDTMKTESTASSWTSVEKTLTSFFAGKR